MRLLFLLFVIVKGGKLWNRVDNVSKFIDNWLEYNGIDNCFFQGDLKLMCLKNNELFKVILKKIYFI